MRYALAGLTLLLLSAPAGAAESDPARQCQAKVNKCISLCVRQNPLSVCRTYCKRDFVCQLAWPFLGGWWVAPD